ncbi:MAG: hypothetical protein ACK4FZ_13205 [Vogesella sp.]|uniref:hypothetical protein n=1 Tax=Vogesella sp. TaxID=1904252 RepID=UPI00391A1F5C
MIHRPVITFFHTDGCEWQTVAPIADEAKARGFPVRFSTDLTEKVQIGVYCQHACKPNADLSAIMLHDLAQRHDIWPDFWDYEPWHHFDFGFLPGNAWAERWLAQASKPHAHPRLGIFNVGWPKADLIYRNRDVFAKKSEELRAQLGLKHPHTILYAPSWENNGKQDDFVQRLRDLPVNLLLKQAPWSEAYPQVLDNIRRMNQLHEGLADNIHIVDPNVSIMYCIGVADLLVSDESSVLIEAALHGVPSVAVTDWLIPDRMPPRFACVPFDNVRKTTKSELRKIVQSIIVDPLFAREQATILRDHHFSHFGQSAVMVVDLLEAEIEGRDLPLLPLSQSNVALNTDLQSYQEAEAFFQSGNQSAAKQILQDLVSKGTPCWQPYNDLAAIAFSEGNVTVALNLISQAVAKEDSIGITMRNMAQMYQASGAVDDAAVLMAKILQHNPSDDEVKMQLAALLSSNFQANVKLETCHMVINTLLARQ